MQITGGSPAPTIVLPPPPPPHPRSAAPQTSWLLQLSALEQQPEFAPAQPQKAANALLGIVGVCVSKCGCVCVCVSKDGDEWMAIRIISAPWPAWGKRKWKWAAKAGGGGAQRDMERIEQDLIWFFSDFKLGLGKFSSLNLNSERCLWKNISAVRIPDGQNLR